MKRPVIGLLAIALLAVGYWLGQFIARDSCLDAGGMWRDAGGVCVGIEPRPGEISANGRE